MTPTNTTPHPNLTVTCSCGCGRVGPRRGKRGYVRSCYERWLRAGSPESGPPPPKTSNGVLPEEEARARADQRARTRWAERTAEQIGEHQVLGVDVAPAQGWAEQATCRPAPGAQAPGDWFPAAPPTEALRRICDACPVRTDCLTHALTRPERWGVWAGQSETQLITLRRRVREARSKTRAARRVA